MGPRPPGELELAVLLSLAGFPDEASGREVYDAIVAATGRDVSVASIHITLNRLHEKGWAERRTARPAPGRGGKPRRRYALSEAGARVVARQKEQLDRLWRRASENPLIERET